jgi:hypothetical protein
LIFFPLFIFKFCILKSYDSVSLKLKDQLSLKVLILKLLISTIPAACPLGKDSGSKNTLSHDSVDVIKSTLLNSKDAEYWAVLVQLLFDSSKEKDLNIPPRASRIILSVTPLTIRKILPLLLSIERNLWI